MTRPPHLGAAEPLRSWSFVVPFIPRSSKNNTQIRSAKYARGRARGRHGKLWVSKDDTVVAEQEAIRSFARAALRNVLAATDGATALGRNYCSVEFELDEQNQQMRVTIHDLGPRAKQREWTKRDVHSVIETTMDALQGVVFDDDRQARDVRSRWEELG